MMELRDNQERYEMMGNSMSGLFCPVREKARAPPIIRKATGQLGSTKNLEASHTSRWRTSKYLHAAKHRLRKNIPLVRPHDVTEDSLTGLVVKQDDLFDWALSSSKQHFHEVDNAPKLCIQTQTCSTNLTDAQAVTTPYAQIPTTSSGMLSPTASDGASVVMETMVGTVGPMADSKGPRLEVGPNRHLLFTGHVDEVTTASIVMRNTGSTVLFYEVAKVPRAPTLVDTYKVPQPPGQVTAEALFCCHTGEGMILPDSQQTLLFSFKSNHSGMFSERWALRTSPPAHINLASGAKTPRRASGVYNLFFKGICSQEDTNEHLRQRLRKQQEKSVLALEMGEILNEVVRRVKTPRREEVVRAKEKAAFESVNQFCGMVYDQERYDSLSRLFNRSRDVLLGVHAIVAPHEELEDWIADAWDSSVDSIFNAIKKALTRSGLMDQVVVDGHVISAVPPPPPAKESRKKKSKGKRKEDGSLDGSQGQGGPPSSVTHPVVQAAVDISKEVRVAIHRSTMRPLCSSTDLARSALLDLADAIEEAYGKAREAANIPYETAIPPMPPAFTPEGAQAWARVMESQTRRPSVAAPPAKNAKAAPPAKKDAKSKEPPGPTPEKIDQYRYLLYKEVGKQLGDIAEKYFETALSQDIDQAVDVITASDYSMDYRAVLRQSDVEGQRVVLQVDLDVSKELVLNYVREWELPLSAQLAPSGTFATAVQSIQAALDFGPTSLIIASHLSQPKPNGKAETSSHSSSSTTALVSGAGDLDAKAVPQVSMERLLQPLSEALGTPLTMVPHVTPKAAKLSTTFATGGVYLLERLEADDLVDPLTPDPTPLSDDEKERYPTFEDEATRRRRLRREEREKKAVLHPDIGKALSEVTDVFVADDPHVS